MCSNEITDYQSIFLNDIPLLDVRASVEFAKGAFPTSTNLPLMNDQERKKVGICYKQQGKMAAIELGHKLLNDEIRQQRIEAWRAYCLKHPHGYLYCLRGGLRSHIVQEWLKESGVDYPLVKGGYKVLRNYLLNTIDRVAQMPMLVLSGNTGCGKTRLIVELAQGIDLEGMARHRGSSFGRTVVEQSNQIEFENRLAISLLKKQQQGIARWVIEDECHSIGANHVPLVIYETMTQSPVVIIDDPFEVRLARLQEEYIDNMRSDFVGLYGEELGWLKFSEYLQQGIYTIRKRLGHERYLQLSNAITGALATDSSDAHQSWLVPLLNEYYDPMYTYQLNKKKERVIFRGNFAAVREFLLQGAS